MRKMTAAEVRILRTLVEGPALLLSRATDALITDGFVAYQDWHGHHHILDAGRAALEEISSAEKKGA